MQKQTKISPSQFPYQKVGDAPLDELDLGRADFSKAIQFVEKNSLREITENASYKKIPLSCNLDRIGQFGIGLQLYFQFLKKTALVFLIMFLISVPGLYSNIDGKGVIHNQALNQQTFFYQLDGKLSSSYQLVITTLANQKTLTNLETYNDSVSTAELLLIKEANQAKIEEYQDQMENRLMLVSLTDLGYSFVFVLFIIYLRYSTNKQAKKDDEENIDTKDFSLKITNFPSDIRDEYLFKNLFNSLIPNCVVEVQFAKNYYGTLSKYQKLAALETQHEVLEKKLQYKTNSVSKKEVDKLEKTIRDIQINAKKKIDSELKDINNLSDYPTLHAYVIFSTVQQKLQIQEIYRILFFFQIFQDKYQAKSILKKIFRCLYHPERRMPQELRLDGKYFIQFSQPDAPSNILWENLDCTASEHFIRRLISVLLVLLLMFMTFFLIFFAGAVQSENTDQCEADITLEEAEKFKIKSDQGDDSAQTQINCFCMTNSYWTIIDNEQINKICYDWLVKAIWNLILIVGSALIILLVNTFLKILLRKLGKYERYPTVTKEVSSSTMKIFRAMFINTAIITLLIHAKIGDFVLSIEISNIIPPLKDYMEDNSDQYPNDFNRGWYLDVGSKIMTTIVLSVVSPHITWMIVTFFLRCWKSYKAKKKIIQREMNNTILAVPFDLTTKYALTLNIIFVSLFYSSGMPLLLLLASCSLFTQYLVEKHQSQTKHSNYNIIILKVLRYNSKPPEYSSYLNSKILKILPYAIILHLAIAIWTYGAEGIFPETISTELQTNSIGESQVLQQYQDTEIYNRAYKVLWLFGLLIVLIFGFLIDKTLLNIFIGCCCSKRRRLKIHSSGTEIITYQNELQRLEHYGIASYDINKNFKYKDIIDAIKNIYKLDTYKSNQATEVRKMDEETQALKS